MHEPLQKSIHKQYQKKYQALLIGLVKRLGGARLRLGLGWARIFYRLQIEEDASIPVKGGCLVAFNHVSDIADTMVYLVIHHRRPDVYLFSWSLNIGIISGLLEALGLPESGEHLLVADMRRTLNVNELLRARQVLLDGGCVAIAPEGETTWDGRLQSPLAPGAAWLALHTAVPIIPIISRGGYDVQPLWQREKIHLTGRIRIRIGQPLVLCEQPLERVSDAQLQTASQRLWQVLAELLTC
jgi:1-acyl-sn-glycerol-3-phosphate acyltransferase